MAGLRSKRYDADKLRDHRDFFDTHLKGVVVIHLVTTTSLRQRSIFASAKFLHHRRKGSPRRERLDFLPGDPGEKEVKRNSKIRRLRARVETTFATLSNTVKSLMTPFYEDIHVHDDIVTFAAGVHNFVVEQNLE